MNHLLYIDPGLGAMIAQAAIAALAGFVFFYKTVIAMVKGWFGIKKEQKQSSFDNSYDADTDKD